jgi:heat shock 70kDa protein 1/2/6/8
MSESDKRKTKSTHKHHKHGKKKKSQQDKKSLDEHFFGKSKQKKPKVKNNIVENIVGIDLGTTHSCVSVWKDHRYEIIPDEKGNKTIPSVVAFTNKSRYIGHSGKNQLLLNPENAYYDVKRIIGRKYSDKNVQKDKKIFTFDMVEGEHDSIVLPNHIEPGKDFAPEEISALVLQRLKLMAEEYLGRSVSKAVITIPAYFNDSQRQATCDAARIAGLECARTINEPTAAALAYGMERLSLKKDEETTILVYDLGGGTLDVSLLVIANGVFEVIGTSGNTHLGGEDFDECLIEHCMEKFMRKHKIDSLEGLPALSYQKLKKSCEIAKKILSSSEKSIIAVRDFYEGKNLLVNITTKEFHKMCADLFILCIKPVESLLEDCEYDMDVIDEIILVGGSTRMPMIQDNLTRFFKGHKPICTINPDEAVAAGAAIQAHIVSCKDDPFSNKFVVLDVIPLSLGVETIGGEMTQILQRNTIIPATRKKKFSTDKDYETEVKIKVVEGERKLTKDNFKVGEFILTGLEKAPRGIPEINITFSIDVNGIVNVTAVDRKNKDVQNSIIVKSNKGRLSEKQIKRLVKESRKLEQEDRVNRKKKRLFYEIEDLCSNIKDNATSKKCYLRVKDLEKIVKDLGGIVKWMIAKPWHERDIEELDMIVKRIKRKYSALIFRVTGKESKVQGLSSAGEQTCTGLYDNEDEEKVFEEIDKEEFGADDENLEELKNMRETLKELCYSIFDALSSTHNKMTVDEKRDLRDLIDDSVLWLHVNEKISMLEYKNKIEQINKACEDSLSKYDEGIYEKMPEGPRDELENLCLSIKSGIVGQLFPIEKIFLSKIENVVDEYLDWFVKIDVRGIKVADEEFIKRRDRLNGICGHIMMTVDVEVPKPKEEKTKKSKKQVMSIIEELNAKKEEEERKATDVEGTTIEDIRKLQKEKESQDDEPSEEIENNVPIREDILKAIRALDKMEQDKLEQDKSVKKIENINVIIDG